MDSKTFKVHTLCSEISLEKVAAHFGINKKYRWEEYLYLGEEQLRGIISAPANKRVNIYHFGSIVFINMVHHEIVDVVDYLKKIEKNLKNADYGFFDDYILEPGADSTQIGYDRMTAPSFEPYHEDILSIVLAKSVALEKIEKDIENLLDEIEENIDRMKNGRLKISDRKLASLSAEILGFKFNTISYIMLLDKPDITWFNQDSEELYMQLAQLFELRERYDKIQSKSELLLDITRVFASLTHERRGTRLELAVILLITFEILLTLFDYIFLK